jgi:hypothetical protein
MFKNIAMMIVAFALTLVFSSLSLAQQLSDYLITSNIGDFIASANPTSGKGPGIVVGADHFYRDHTDMTYRISYFNLQTRVGPEVQVTQHSGSDSDKWLLHEVERDFRTYYGLPGDSFVMRVIDGNTIMAAGSGGWDYRWLSGNKVIRIEYTDLMMEKPQPLEVVRAYLAKQPSTLTTMTSADLRTAENKTKWIKDEMDRRLWLCDKWFMQFQLGKVQQGEVFRQAVKSMNVFLDYREKYYGMKAADEKNLLAGFLNTNNGTSIKAKLTEYKNWWAVNKDKPISL